MADDLAKKHPMIVELKKRVNVYYKITVKNLREVIPKNIRATLIERLQKEIEFEIFQACLGEKDQVQNWLKLNTGEVEERRKKENEYEVVRKAEQFLLTHPAFAKYRTRTLLKGKEEAPSKKDSKEESPIRKENKAEHPKDTSKKSKQDPPHEPNKHHEVHEFKPKEEKEHPKPKE